LDLLDDAKDCAFAWMNKFVGVRILNGFGLLAGVKRGMRDGVLFIDGPSGVEIVSG
jgi:hypothetical protein